eukprot:g33192.t1
MKTPGIYKFTDYDASMKTVEGIQWFEELSLYAEVLLHRTSLRNDLAECIRRSPGCTRMFCEYAKEFPEQKKQEQVELAIKCCKQNHVYQVLYPDPAMLLENIQIFEEDDEEDLLNYSDSMDDTDRNDSEQPVSKQSSTSTTRLSGRLPSFGMSGSPSPGSKQQSLADDQDDDPKMKDRLSGADLLQQPAPPRRGNGLQTLADDLRKFLANLDTKEVEAEEVPEMLRKYIPELNPETGTHVVFKQQGERERGESSCISILALVTGSYEMFTMPQNPTNRLRREQWYQLRDIIRWIQPTQDQLHAVLILLSIRALGKSKELVNQLPKDKRRPERAVLHIIEHHKNVVPSADSLGVDGLRGVKKAGTGDLRPLRGSAVQNRFVFQTCVSRCKYHFSGDRVRVEMTGGNWGRTNDPDTDMTSLAYIVKERASYELLITEDKKLVWPEGPAGARVEALRPLSAQVLPRHKTFLSFLKGLFQLEPLQRLRATQAHQMEFLTTEVQE